MKESEEEGWRARKLRQGEGNVCCKVRRNCNISQHDATHGYTYYICHERLCIDHVFTFSVERFFREPPNIVNNPDRFARVDRRLIETRTETTSFKRITFNSQFSVLSLRTANVYPGLLYLYSRVSIFARDYSTPAA